MRSTWRVTKVTAVEGQTKAELVRVEWFKKNPAHEEMMAEYEALVESIGREAADEQIDNGPEQEWVPEWLDDVQPGEEGAEFYEADVGSLTIDITNALDLSPGDNVILTLDALERVPA